MSNATVQRMCSYTQIRGNHEMNRKIRTQLHGTVQSDCGVISQGEAEVVSPNATI